MGMVLLMLLLSVQPDTVVFAEDNGEPESCNIIHAGELRSEPGYTVGTVVGPLCVGDEVEFLGWGHNVVEQSPWYRVRVRTSTCGEQALAAGTVGWIPQPIASSIQNLSPFLGAFDGSNSPAPAEPGNAEGEGAEAGDAEGDEAGNKPVTYEVIDEAVSPDSSILSAPRATPDQAVAYILKRGTTYSPRDVEVIVGYYWRFAPQYGVDPLVAIAQNILETNNMKSWWAQSPRNNPAGIMVTGERRSSPPAEDQRDTWVWNEEAQVWRRGRSFSSWEESVQYHVGLLLAYAVRDEDANEQQRALIERVLGGRSLPAGYRGSAAVLRGLNGRWAVPGTTYASKISRCANEIRTMPRP